MVEKHIARSTLGLIILVKQLLKRNPAICSDNGSNALSGVVSDHPRGTNINNKRYDRQVADKQAKLQQFMARNAGRPAIAIN